MQSYDYTSYFAVVTVIGTYIPMVDSKFRWPGYYISFHSFIQIVTVLLLFSDKWNDIVRTKSIKLSKDFCKDPVIPHHVSCLCVVT